MARVNQEVELTGRGRLRTSAADASIAVAEFRAMDQVRQLALEVRRVYYQVVLAKADLDVATGALGEIDRVIELNRARAGLGEISGVPNYGDSRSSACALWMMCSPLS